MNEHTQIHLRVTDQSPAFEVLVALIRDLPWKLSYDWQGFTPRVQLATLTAPIGTDTTDILSAISIWTASLPYPEKVSIYGLPV